tara:strand:- start:1278 stop:1724 length:447 start_codon:yes stop_codon:yes gene_type:complete
MSDYDFDVNTVKEVDDDFKPLPPGNYPVSIDYCDVRDTKKMNGEMLHLEFLVTEGNWQGRKLFDNLLFKHENPTAVEMGKKKIAALARAIGLEKFKLNESRAFLNKPLVVDIEIKKGTDGYADSNEITKYMTYQDAPQSEPVKDDIPF